jgi:hypothetical protein
VREEKEGRTSLVSIATTHVSQLLSPWKQGEPAQRLHCLRGDTIFDKKKKKNKQKLFDKTKPKIMKATPVGLRGTACECGHKREEAGRGCGPGPL